MDKYFEESYDPALDVGPSSGAGRGKNGEYGFVQPGDFAGWDHMLEVVKQRNIDRAERKKREKESGGKSKDKKKKGREDPVVDQWKASGDDTNLMDIVYKKRGAMREWDMGKDD
jgi:hypothetical protein